MVSQHAAALTVLSLAATGAVLAARPAPPASGPQASHARHVAPVEHEPRRATLATPGASRLKIKFQDDYRARLLPNGSLLSLTGRDISSTNRSIEAFGLELTPAVTMSDAKLDDLRLAIEHRSDTVMPDIAATFWADGTPRAVAAAAKHFVSDSAIDYASVVKVRQLPEAVLDAKERPRPTTTSKPTVDPSPDPDYWSTDTPYFLEREQWFIDHAERMEQGPLPISKEIEIASAAIQMERFLDSMNRAHDQARRRNREFMENRNLRGADLVICCIFQLVDPDGAFPSGDEVWRKSCLGDEGLTTSDICDSLNNDDTSISVVQGIYGVDTCGAVCLDYSPMAYGACCTPNLRDGEDSFVSECVEGGGVFEGTIPGSTLMFNSYWSCDVCPEVLGSCCLNAVVETPGVPGGWVWNGAIVEWAKAYCPSSADFYTQPDVASGRLRGEVGYWNNTNTSLIDTNPGTPLWEWQNFNTPPATFNPPIIVNARVISNDDQTSACDRCLAAGGYYVPNMLPNIRFGGDLFCGVPGVLGIDDCENGTTSQTEILGGCSTSGAYTITTETACNDGCPVGHANDLHELSCWQQYMILPTSIGPEGHPIHSGNWRPLWVQWFTPPPVLEEPDPATWLVPYWEYAGTYSEWTGWDPERWWDEGFQPNLAAGSQPATSHDQFRLLMGSRPADNANATWYPALSTLSQIIPAPPTEDDDSVFVPNYMVPNYGPCIRHGFGPTGLEYYGDYGIPQQTGDPLSWGVWPVLPETDAYTFEFQCIGADGASSPPPDQMFPWDHARNRWTDDSKFFRIGTPPSDDDTGFGRINNRYLNLTTPGVTIWNYYGDGNPPHPGDLVPPHDWTYGYPYVLGEPSDPLRGSCYFPHSHNSPTVPLTNTLPGIQATYTGAGCNEPGCCAAIEAVVPGCCPEAIGTGDLTTWDPLCVQVALDIVLAGQGAGVFFDSRVCTGITPYLVPEYASLILGNDNLRPGEYNPDPRNSQLNPYLDATLPAYVDPARLLGPPADTCTVGDTSAFNRFHPLERTNDLTLPIQPPSPPPANVEPAPGSAYAEYDEVRHRSGRLYQFMPRCAGIYSASGQCNVAGNYSGRSSWAAIADDETTLIGCKDYDCCMRVISTILDDKDDAANGDLYTDLEWVNWGHLGYPPEIADYPELLPPMAGQWTAAMASRARSLCYPNVVQQDDPDFFNLQFHMNRQALAQSPAGYGACCFGANCDFVWSEECASLGGTWNGVGTTCNTNPCNGGPIEVLNNWIVGPDEQRAVQDDPLLRDLVWAPFSWSDNSQWDYAAASTCRPPHQNIFGLLPGPYYAGDGLAIYPWDIDPVGNNADPYESVATASQFFADEAGTTMGAFGLSVNIAVLGETAWLQERVVNGVTVGAVHSDLGQVVLEGPAMNLPTVDMPFTGPIAQSQAARCTAVLGVIAATDNGFGVTGMAHEATTMFFPTESTSGTRIEDAFLHALSQLNAGDVMMLAWQATSADGFVLNDPGVMTLVDLARASGISVVVPAGDMQQPVGITTEDAGIIVVGGATPASRDSYLRWWSSNYSTAETVAFTPGTVNICAWGGGVTTTGGNANLSMVAIADTYTEDPATKETTLTLKGRQQSYTNDFGSRLDGSLAAASQITGAAACAQGVCRQLYNGDSMLAADLHLRLYTTSTYFNGSDSGGLGPGFPTGYGGNGSPGAIYTWDINETLDTPASVGRFPQLGKLMRDLSTSIPEDFVEGDWARISRLDIVTGTLDEGDRFSLVVDADEDVAYVNSAFAGIGSVSTNFDVPGPIQYTAAGQIVDIMVTVQTSGRVNLTGPFGIVDTRFGPWTYAVYMCYVFNFQTGRWEGFDGPVVTNPGDGAPTPDVFGPYVPFATVSQYVDPQTDKLFIRFMSTSGGTADPYNMGFDYVWFQNAPAPQG